MRISEKVINAVNVNRLSIDELVYIYNLYFKQGWEISIFPASLSKLKRFKILSESEDLTSTGENILFDCLDEDKIIAPKDDKDQFDEIWFLFPKDDEFKGFSKTRNIRVNKQQAKEEYYACLAKGYAHEYMVKCLKNEIANRAQSTKENLFKYMRSPVNWFKLETFLDYDDIESQEKKYEFGKKVI